MTIKIQPLILNNMKTQSSSTKKALINLKKPSFDDFKTFNERFSIIHEFIVRVAIILGLSTLIFFFIAEISSHKYVLTDIEVANSIEESEKKSEKIYGKDLKQKVIRKIKKTISRVKKEPSNHDNSEEVSTETTTLNVGGFDLNKVFLYFRNFFKLQNREITAYIMDGERINRKQFRYTVLLSIGRIQQDEKHYNSKEEITEYLSEKILTYNSPYELGYYTLKQPEKKEIADKKFKEVIAHLEVLCRKEGFWEKTFHRNNWKWKKVYLEMIKFCRDYKVQIIEDKFIEYPDKNLCQRTLCKIDSVNKTNNKIVGDITDAVRKHTEDDLRTDSIQGIRTSQNKTQTRLDSINNYLTKFHGYVK
jgi:hypothetical protein